VIIVEENKTIFPCPKKYKDIIRVKNYWEAVGYIQCMKSKIVPQSVRRPFDWTNVFK